LDYYCEGNASSHSHASIVYKAYLNRGYIFESNIKITHDILDNDDSKIFDDLIE
jgi:hypothetical protein